jgi:glycerol-3-phosphate acyltransferase PlsY
MIKIFSLIYLPLMGYLGGSISSAIIVSKLMGLADPRQTGSGNPGATNVLRSGNKVAAALTLAGDIIKGTIPVLIADAYTNNATLIAIVALCAFLGHLFPIFFGFKGGKGVATAIGIFLGISLKVSGFIMLIWLACAVVSRYSSLSALVASAATPILFSLFKPEPAYIVVSAILAGLLFWRHSANIQRLRDGTESKINF